MAPRSSFQDKAKESDLCRIALCYRPSNLFWSSRRQIQEIQKASTHNLPVPCAESFASAGFWQAAKRLSVIPKLLVSRSCAQIAYIRYPTSFLSSPPSLLFSLLSAIHQDL